MHSVFPRMLLHSGIQAIHFLFVKLSTTGKADSCLVRHFPRLPAFKSRISTLHV